jgi:D-sedoheptulose 7-phosphate isomerase
MKSSIETLQSKLEQHIDDAVRAVTQLKNPEHLQCMEQVAKLLAETFAKGGKVIIAGNGGSMCDAAHFAEELTGVFKQKRKALPAIVLSEVGHITCTANDIGYEYVFSRGVEAFGKPGDVFIGLTTSGNSENIAQAIRAAKQLGLVTIAFLGKTGGKIKGCADIEMIISGFHTSDRIQEAHMAAMHMIIDLIECLLFPEPHSTYV